MFWFFNFPSLRYGGYSLLIIFISILFSNLFNFGILILSFLKKNWLIGHFSFNSIFFKEFSKNK